MMKAVERRKTKRFRLQDGVVVQFYRRRLFNLIKPEVVKSEPILNMSAGGLAFKYEGRAMSALDGCVLSIQSTEGRDRIESLGFKIISDIPFRGKGAAGSQPMRRCGIKFENIAPEIESQMDRFIEKCAHRNFGTSPSKKLRNGFYYIDLSSGSE